MSSELRAVLPLLPGLVAVADHGGVTAAAAALGMAQPSLSRDLARLSERLGVPLLVSAGRGIRLSAEARALLPHARAASLAAAAGIDAARGEGDRRDRTARIAFQTALGHTVVPALIRAFAAENPDARVELEQGSRQLCVDALTSGSADLVLLSPPAAPSPSIRTTTLFAERLVLVVPGTHPLATRRLVRLRDVATEPAIMMKRDYGLRTIADGLFDRAGVTPQIAFEGEDIQTVRGLVAAGLGVALLPVAPQTFRGIAEIPLGDAGAERVIGASWSVDAPAGRATRALRSLILDRGPALVARGRAHAAEREILGS